MDEDTASLLLQDGVVYTLRVYTLSIFINPYTRIYFWGYLLARLQVRAYVCVCVYFLVQLPFLLQSLNVLDVARVAIILNYPTLIRTFTSTWFLVSYPQYNLVNAF